MWQTWQWADWWILRAAISSTTVHFATNIWMAAVLSCYQLLCWSMYYQGTTVLTRQTRLHTLEQTSTKQYYIMFLESLGGYTCNTKNHTINRCWGEQELTRLRTDKFDSELLLLTRVCRQFIVPLRRWCLGLWLLWLNTRLLSLRPEVSGSGLTAATLAEGISATLSGSLT